MVPLCECAHDNGLGDRSLAGRINPNWCKRNFVPRHRVLLRSLMLRAGGLKSWDLYARTLLRSPAIAPGNAPADAAPVVTCIAGRRLEPKRMTEVLAYTIREACLASGIGRTTLYQLLKSGALRARKHGKRTLILHGDLQRWLERLPDLAPPRAQPPPKRRRSTSEVRSAAA
jgi:excisionase family DNA binding protein